MRKYDESDLKHLQDNYETVELNGVTIQVKKIPGEVREGYMDPWVIETINPAALTRADGAITENTNATLDAMMSQMSPEQFLVALRNVMEGSATDSTFKEEWFERDIDVQLEELILSGNRVGLWRYNVPGDESRLRPCFIHIHGGGWFAGHPRGNDNFLRYIAEKAEAVVFDIDYSLSPEFQYPNGLNDCYNALKHIHEHSEVYGVDKNRIAVGGGSAGGNYTTALALRARDEGLPLIALQIPMVPAVLLAKDGAAAGYTWDPSQFTVAPETQRFVPEIKDPRHDPHMDIMIAGYLGDADPSEPYASPMLAENFTGLPPALIITSEFDALRLQGEFYGSQLAKANVPVRIIRYKGQTHSSVGNSTFGIVPQSEDCAFEIVKAIREL